ncbi:MAG: hypothetical protein DDT27_01639 [Dehalococcoidia bacterium]|nr:hypothetical protein [Chloroflexota bacterium]
MGNNHLLGIVYYQLLCQSFKKLYRCRYRPYDIRCADGQGTDIILLATVAQDDLMNINFHGLAV